MVASAAAVTSVAAAAVAAVTCMSSPASSSYNAFSGSGIVQGSSRVEVATAKASMSSNAISDKNNCGPTTLSTRESMDDMTTPPLAASPSPLSVQQKQDMQMAIHQHSHHIHVRQSGGHNNYEELHQHQQYLSVNLFQGPRRTPQIQSIKQQQSSIQPVLQHQQPTHLYPHVHSIGIHQQQHQHLNAYHQS